MILGLAGYATSGKDTVGRYLVEEHGFTRLAFADTLKRFALAVNPMVGWNDDPEGNVEAVRLYDVLQDCEFDWDQAKKVDEVRQILQRIGTEGGREILGENVWVDGTLAGIDPHGDNYVVTDVRFLNEAAAIKSRGGSVWRVSRPGTGPVNRHPSETALDDYAYDAVIDNSSTPEDLHKRVEAFLVRV